jgi:hypothetical protein
VPKPTPALLPTGEAAAPEPAVPATDPKNASYTIEGQTVTLVNGEAEVPAAPGSATMVTTTLFGEPTAGDLDGDKVPDAAVMLVQSPGGSGTFYYEAAALNRGGIYAGTNAILLGDRIAPQTTQVSGGVITVNYAERASGEPMTAQPSVGVSKYFQVENDRLAEVQQP